MIQGGIVGGYYGIGSSSGGLTESEVTTLINTRINNRQIIDVATQTQLDAVSTSEQPTVRITANFGTYYRGDTLLYNPSTSTWSKITDARYFKDGFVVWWGTGQTEELPEGTLPENSAVSTNGIKGWSTNAPQRTKFGGIAATVTNINAESDADFSDNVPNSVIELPAGEYSFYGVFYGNQTPDSDLHLRLEEIQSGADDIIRIAGTTRQSQFIGRNTHDVHAVYEINRPHFVITSAMKFYLRLVGFGSDKNRLVGFLQIEEIDS